MTCLIIKNDGFGDIILASGIISEISQIFSGDVDLVTCSSNKEVAESISGIRNFYYISRDELRFNKCLRRLQIGKPVIPYQDLQVLNKINSIKYNHAISLRRYIRASTLLVMNAVQAENKYCCWQFCTNAPTAVANKYSKNWRHYSGDPRVISELTYFQQFIESEFGRIIDPTPRLRCTQNADDRPDPNSVGICMGGKSTNWPSQYWIDLIRGLQKDGWTVKLFGGKDVLPLASDVASACPGIDNLVGAMTFIESTNILRKLEAFIGNDTGFTHFASLLTSKILVIYGGGTFGRFFPWPCSVNQYVIYYGDACFDCDWKCKFFINKKRCMTMVKPKDVLIYFKHIIQNRDTPQQYNINDISVKYRIAWRRWKDSSQLMEIPGNRFIIK